MWNKQVHQRPNSDCSWVSSSWVFIPSLRPDQNMWSHSGDWCSWGSPLWRFIWLCFQCSSIAYNIDFDIWKRYKMSPKWKIVSSKKNQLTIKIAFVNFSCLSLYCWVCTRDIKALFLNHTLCLSVHSHACALRCVPLHGRGLTQRCPGELFKKNQSIKSKYCTISKAAFHFIIQLCKRCFQTTQNLFLYLTCKIKMSKATFKN